MVATVSNPYTDKPAYSFEEDDSIVECRMVREVTEEDLLNYS
ncbi:hypothetical protein VPHD148_0157 [Vibrio phage D148]